MDLAAAEQSLARARVHYARGDADRCRHELEAGLTASRGSASPVETRLLIEHARLRSWDFDPPRSVEAARIALEAARRTRTDLPLAESVIATALYLHGSADCFGHWRAARRGAREATDVDLYLECGLVAAGAYYAFARPDAAMRMAQVVLETARRKRKRIWAEHARWQIARIGLLAFGDLETGMTEIRALLGVRALGLSRLHVAADLALALADAGRIGEARAVFSSRRRLIVTPWDRAVVSFYGAEVEWAAGDPARSLAAAEESLASVLGPTEITTRVVRLWSLYELGRPQGDPCLSASAWPLFAYAPLLSKAFAALANDDLGSAETAFLDAARAARGLVLREDLRAAWAAAETARRRGDGARALRLLREVDDRARTAGLLSILRRTRRSLSNLEPARRSNHRASPLTTREVDVLRHVARGESSSEIAANLDVARSTIEAHVRSAMRKLDARTRMQAVAIAIVSPLHAQPTLDDGERALLDLLADGTTTVDAAELLGISRSTAIRRLRRAKTAFGVTTTAEAVAAYAQRPRRA